MKDSSPKIKFSKDMVGWEDDRDDKISRWNEMKTYRNIWIERIKRKDGCDVRVGENFYLYVFVFPKIYIIFFCCYFFSNQLGLNKLEVESLSLLSFT